MANIMPGNISKQHIQVFFSYILQRMLLLQVEIVNRKFLQILFVKKTYTSNTENMENT